MATSDVDVESGQGKKGIPHFTLLLDQGVLTPEIENYKYEGSGTEEDPYVVEWIPDDPRNPMTWPNGKKWIMCLCVAMATFTVSFCSSMYTGGITQVIVEFNTSQTLVNSGLSLFVLGFALGPLLWAPFSELYGRQIVFFGTFFMFTCFNAGAGGSQNIWTLVILRFFAGSFGSSPLTNAGGVVADSFSAKERGLAMSVFSLAPFMGPCLGPIVGGFLGMNEGWRWVEGSMAIFSGIIFIAGSLSVPETYPPVLSRKRAQASSKKTGKIYMSRTDIDQGKTTVGEAFSAGLKRPWISLFCEPIVFSFSLYMAIIYGTLYMLFGAFPIVYRVGRGWNEGVAGLPFIGVAIGMIIASIYILTIDFKRYIKCVEASPTGFAAPEDRLPPAIIGAAVLPIGLFWFAWTNYPEFPWIASVLAAVPFGFGMVTIFLSIMVYLIDAYTIFAASVLAGNGIIRSVFGAAFPMFTLQMYQNLGIHWASTIPAFLALACLPFPYLFYKYGAQIRKKCKYAAEADAYSERVRGQIARSEPAAKEDDQTDSLHSRHSGGFEEMKAGNETENALHRSATARTNRSTRTVEELIDNPYNIDRVNTRESFKRVKSNRHRAPTHGSTSNKKNADQEVEKM